jgi:hypothetical protein
MKNTLIALAIAIIATVNVLFAETARVQVIHNSALPAAAEVDVYINGAKPEILDNFAFRAATPYVELPAGEDIIVTIAGPTSMNADDQKIADFNLGKLEAGVEYVVMANGILGDGFANPDMARDINFNLYPMAGRTASMDDKMVDVNVFHGVTDAPAVDVYADMNSDALISNLDYVQSTGYVSLPAADYDLTVTVAGNKDVVAGVFDADISGLAGGAAVVFASGFLAPDGQGTEVPMNYGFGLFAALPDGTVIELPMHKMSNTAKVQVIHNSALPAAAEVDVYINGAKPEILDNFAFRAATPYVELPAGEDIIVTIAGPTSMNADDQKIADFNLGKLEAGVEYVVMANGILGDGFANPDMARDINFNLYPMAGRTASMDDKMVDVNVFHGVTDAPAVDVYADMNSDALISNLDYVQSTGYVSLPAADYDLTVTVAGNKDVVAGVFDADISGLGGGAAVVFASGFLAPDGQGTEVPMNYGFGLFAALPDGTVIELPMHKMSNTAKVQVIHNSALPAAAEVDVYINGAKPEILDNFAFRAATPYVELPAGEDIIVTIAGPTSMNADDQKIADFNLGKLEAGMEYVVMANGILGDGFANPDMARDINFNLYPMAGRTASMDDKMVDVNVFHGVTDAPAVDVYADMNSDALISNLDYVQSTGYVSLPAADYDLTVTVAGNKDVVAGVFDADISGLGGGAAVVFASGFLAPDGQGTEVPMNYGFGLFAALPDGTVIELPMHKMSNTAKVQVIHNSALPAAAEVDVYINGAKPEILDNFAFRAATPYVELPAGEDIIVTIAGPTSMNADDQKIADFNLGKLEAGVEYVVMANGILGDGFANPDMARDINFNLYPMAGRTASMDDKMVDVNVFHGVTDAPAVDVYADMNSDALISNLDYVQSTGYVSLPSADYDLTVTVAGNKDVVAGVFDADISGLGGGAAVVFASGFLAPDGQGTEVPMNYGFGLFAALPDGTVIELPNQNTASVDNYGYYENKINIVPIPVTDSFYILSEDIMLKDIELYDLNGMLIKRQSSQSNNEMKISVDDLSSGYYMVLVNSDKGRIAKSLIVE